jgi:hypothetical protein
VVWEDGGDENILASYPIPAGRTLRFWFPVWFDLRRDPLLLARLGWIHEGRF